MATTLGAPALTNAQLTAQLAALANVVNGLKAKVNAQAATITANTNAIAAAKSAANGIGVPSRTCTNGFTSSATTAGIATDLNEIYNDVGSSNSAITALINAVRDL